MSTPALVLTALQTQLENHASLTYIKNVWIGLRDNVAEFPCIFIEPVSTEEVDNGFACQDVTFNVAVVGVVETTDEDMQIIGDTDDKGILDLENDIKKALGSDRTIGNTSYYSVVPRTNYAEKELNIRKCQIDVQIKFKQNAESRS